MKFIMNETNTMKKTLVFSYICKHKTPKQRVKTADGEENRSFWDQGGELNGPTGGGELNRIGWKNIHPWKKKEGIERGGKKEGRNRKRRGKRKKGKGRGTG